MKKLFSTSTFPLFLIFALCSLMATSCVDQKFDEPPSESGDPGISSNTTIADLKATHVPDQFENITTDVVIEGVVVADDASGNFYRQLIIQDETGGIEVRINLNSLYNDYPVGRRIFIDCKGLTLGDYNGLSQIGGGTYIDDNGNERLAGIEEVLIKDHIYKGARNQTITPKLVTLNNLSTNILDIHINTLIQLEGMEFTQTGQTFATERRSENRVISDCNGVAIDLRSSGYSDFYSEIVPSGNGTIMAIYSVFGNSPQLYIRDPSDLDMEGPRCDGSTGGGPGGSGELISIADVRALFPGTSNAPAGKKISGIVISDGAGGNLNSQNLFIQDDSGAGIVVRFSDTHSFALNESIDINISGVEISEYNGLLQLNNVDLASATSNGPNNFTANTTTIGEVLSDTEKYEGTLVKFENVTLSKSGGSDFAGEITLNDGTGTIALWTFNSATFANSNFPTNIVTLTGIVSQFNDVQITLRNAEDIEGGNTGGPMGTPGEIDESFNSSSAEQDISLTGWSNVAIKGDRKWRAKEFSGNKYAQATAYNDTNTEMETWLITSELEMDVDKMLTFESAIAFWVHNGLSVWISNNYDGSDVNGATWTEVNCSLAGENNADYEWVPSGDIDLSAFSGKIHIGFKYVGSGTAGNTTSYLIDNVKVKKQ